MERLLDEKQLSEVLNRKLPTLRNDRSLKRGIPFVKVGRSVRYRVEDIEAYLAARRVSTENEAA